MGEVYKARDTRLDRSVAIKVLAPEIAGDPDLRARFEREARAVAALDHPHICGIYDVGEANGTHFIVMPCLEGETLAEKLARKAGSKDPALRIEDVLKIAAEIADALDKAHRQGITHRDLKPANIMLTKAGSKLLDFGLAKLKAPGGPISMSGMTHLATQTPQTARGTILGTVQYMAPEQVEGKEADARSDIWALGAVIYEMATGTRPFMGDTPASVISAILKDEPPPVSARQPLAPRAFDHLVSTCLAKEPDQRWQSAADVGRELEWIAQSSREVVEPRATTRTSWRSAAGWIAAAILMVALGATSMRSRFVETPQREPVSFSVYPPPGRVFADAQASAPAPQLALSPDGRHLAFVAAEPQGQLFLWLRTLADAEARRLPGTEDAEQPFWAPDSQSVAFFSQGLLKKRDLSRTAPPEVIARVTVDMRGGAWSPTGAILYNPSASTGLQRVAPTGGAGTLLNLKDASGPFPAARWPVFLPDGQHFLFQTRDPNPDRKGIYVASLDGLTTRRVSGSDWGARYASGYLLLLDGTTLMAHPFDLETHGSTGAPTRVAQPVAGSSTGHGAFSVSPAGVLAYSSGLLTQSELRWIDRAGRTLVSAAPPADYVDFRLSPDESRLAFSRIDPDVQAADVWVRDLARGTESRLTAQPLTDAAPQWSPAGDQIIFRSNRTSAPLELFRTRPSPGASAESVFSREQQLSGHSTSLGNVLSTDWSPDGKFIIYHVTTGESGYDLWALPLEGDRKPMSIAHAKYNELQGVVSPDNRWIAYASDESGKYEIYVQRFPDPSVGQKTTVSTGGGSQPRWSKDGRELFYLRSDGNLMAVAVRTRPDFESGAVTTLFKTALSTNMNAYRMDYVPAADGQRFLMKVPVEGTTPPSITVVLNWTALLKK
jgi:serine/threonine protein kinase